MPHKVTDWKNLNNIEQEMALAFLLWRALRTRVCRRELPTVDGEDATNLAIMMAKRCGIRDEFFKLLFELPILEISCREVEEYETNRTYAAESEWNVGAVPKGKGHSIFAEKRLRENRE